MIFAQTLALMVCILLTYLSFLVSIKYHKDLDLDGIGFGLLVMSSGSWAFFYYLTH